MASSIPHVTDRRRTQSVRQVWRRPLWVPSPSLRVSLAGSFWFADLQRPRKGHVFAASGRDPAPLTDHCRFTDTGALAAITQITIPFYYVRVLSYCIKKESLTMKVIIQSPHCKSTWGKVVNCYFGPNKSNAPAFTCCRKKCCLSNESSFWHPVEGSCGPGGTSPLHLCSLGFILILTEWHPAEYETYDTPFKSARFTFLTGASPNCTNYQKYQCD